MSRLHSFQKEAGLKCFVMYGRDMHFRADVEHERLTHEKITLGADGWISRDISGSNLGIV